MPENRFYIDASLEQPQIELEGEEFRHLQVMRREVGDKIELVNGKGFLAVGTLIEMKKKGAKIEINDLHYTEPKKTKIILAQALTRPNSLDYIIEKGTELDVSEFWLFPAAHSEKKELSPQQQIRLKNLTISALKQSGRLYLPSVSLKPPLPKWAPCSADTFYGDVRAAAPLFFTFPVSSGQDLVFFIGPEKGFSEAELKLLEEAIKAKGVKLHDNILRVDTASIVAMALSYCKLIR